MLNYNANLNNLWGATEPFYERADRSYGQWLGDNPWLTINSQGQLSPGFASTYSPETQFKPGDYENKLLQKQAVESAQARDRMNSQNMSGWATARSGLAMRGGLDQGMRERLAKNYMNQSMMGGQQQAATDQAARLGISADAGKFDVEKGMQASQFRDTLRSGQEQFNIQNATQQNALRRAESLERYRTYMQGMASDRQATATENSGKK